MASTPLFLAGLSIIPTLVWQSSLVLLAIQVGVLVITAHQSGKRIRLLYFVILIISVTFFHLLIPSGRLLYSIGRLRITGGALDIGVRKGLLVTGLVMSSLSTVRSDIAIPGKWGSLLSGLFFYFEELTKVKPNIRRRTFLKDIDALLVPLLYKRMPPPPPRSRSNWNGWYLTLPLVLFHWVLWGVQFGFPLF